jgi:HD-GYP domain-containing protein (c-di-GMP phosphodiesterase class II)
MKLLRLCTQHIRLNEPLPWNVRNEPGHLLLGKGFLLTEQAQIDALLDRGVYVDQDEYEEHLRELKAAKKPKDPFSLWANILKRTGQVLRSHKDNPNFAQDMGELCGQIQIAMKEDIDAGTFEMVYGDPTGYAVSHSLQTAFVASLAAERFGWSEQDRTTLIRAALTMNIAMLDMQNALAQQTTPLTPQQRIDIDTHAAKGRALLEAKNVSCRDWLSTVEHHHVTTDGRGLPQDRSDLSQLACMIHYADVYLAKLSPRASRPAIAVNVAARELFMKSDGANNPFAAAIIKEMGIFPPGSFVKLANGDTAVVLRPGETANTPHVHSLISSDGWVFPDTKERDTSKTEFKIVSAVPRSNVMMRLDRQKLFGYTAA